MTRLSLLMGAALASSLCAPAAGQQPAHPLEPGSYRFETNARNGQRPVCSEQWDLRADGSMTVHSGEEVVEKRYRLAHDRDGDWLIARVVATNGKPDCTGTVTRTPSPDERRTYVIAFNDGRISVCPAPSHTPDGSPYIASCYGSLTRIERAQ